MRVEVDHDSLVGLRSLYQPCTLLTWVVRMGVTGRCKVPRVFNFYSPATFFCNKKNILAGLSPSQPVESSSFTYALAISKRSVSEGKPQRVPTSHSRDAEHEEPHNAKKHSLISRSVDSTESLLRFEMLSHPPPSSFQRKRSSSIKNIKSPQLMLTQPPGSSC